MRTLSCLGLTLLLAVGCRASATVIGGDGSDPAGDTAGGNDTGSGDTGSGDTGSGDTGKDQPVCLGSWAADVVFSGEDPRSGDTMELCSGTADLEIAKDLSFTGTGDCSAGGGDGPPMDFTFDVDGAATEACALTADVNLVYGPEMDTTSTVSGTGSATATDGTFSFEGELSAPDGGNGGGPPPMPFYGEFTLSR